MNKLIVLLPVFAVVVFVIFMNQPRPLDIKFGYQYNKTLGPFYSEGREYYIFDSPNEIYVLHDGEKVPDFGITNKVLNLGKFYEITKNDPLFYSPCVDTRLFRESVKNLIEMEDETLAQLRALPDANSAYLDERNRIFPDDFLSLLPDIIDATENFYKTPSYENAIALLEHYERAVKYYKEDIERRLNLINSLNETDRPIVFFHSATNADIMINDFSVIRRNALEIEKEIERRKKCLIEDCSYIVSGSEYLPLTANYSDGKGYQQLPKELIFPENFSKMRGPYQVKSACWGWNEDLTPKRNLIYLFFIDTYNSPFVILKLATENYFMNISNSFNQRYVREFAKLGIEYDEQSGTADYRCMNLDFYSKITTLDFVLDKLKSERIFNGVNVIQRNEDLKLLHENARLGEEIESRLLGSRYPDCEDLEVLAKTYSNAYNIIRELEKSHPPEELNELTDNLYDKKDLLWKYKLLTENRLVMFPYILNYLEGTLNVFKLIINLNKQNLPIEYVFGLRSDYSLMYFPFVESVWRLKEPLKYMIKRNYELPSIYKTYTELVKMGYSLEDIKRFYVNDLEYLRSVLG